MSADAFDFTDEILTYNNDQVDELCGCTGREKTRSRRVLREFHEDWCFYHMFLLDQEKEMKEHSGG